MPVLKVKKNGIWEDVAGVSGHTHSTTDIVDFPTSIPANGGNADTLDNYHADDFVLSSHFNTAVSTQIGNALKSYYTKDETDNALEDLKSDIGESIVLKNEEWHIIDNNGNIVATFDANGVTTTNVIANTIIINGSDLEELIAAKV